MFPGGQLLGHSSIRGYLGVHEGIFGSSGIFGYDISKAILFLPLETAPGDGRDFLGLGAGKEADGPLPGMKVI